MALDSTLIGVAVAITIALIGYAFRAERRITGLERGLVQRISTLETKIDLFWTVMKRVAENALASGNPIDPATVRFLLVKTDSMSWHEADRHLKSLERELTKTTDPIQSWALHLIVWRLKCRKLEVSEES